MSWTSEPEHGLKYQPILVMSNNIVLNLLISLTSPSPETSYTLCGVDVSDETQCVMGAAVLQFHSESS